MERLTVLFFSRNDIENAIGLVEDMKDVADEIVLVDQSDPKERKKLMAYKKRAGLKKFKVYTAFAPGYPEPLQAYAFSKCTNEWVLRLDTDERIPDTLKRDIKKIITETKLDGFAIKRYEFAGSDGRSDFATWQVRLFKRSKTEYTGILHEQPIIHGSLGKLEGDGYYMSHAEGLMDQDFRNNRPFARYWEINRIDQRLSYDLYNRKMMEYISKFMVIPPERVPGTAIGRLVRDWMEFYEELTFRKPDHELSGFDYYIYYSLIELVFAVRKRKPSDLFRVPASAYRRLKLVDSFKAMQDGEVYFGVSKIINRIGIIRYLELDKPRVVEALTKRYSGKPQGVKLLIELLADKYRQTAGKAQPVPADSDGPVLFHQQAWPMEDPVEKED